VKNQQPAEKVENSAVDIEAEPRKKGDATFFRPMFQHQPNAVQKSPNDKTPSRALVEEKSKPPISE